MPESNAIFVSYRRSDSNDVSGRIYDRLVQHFGPEAVFKDVHSIPYGEDFPTYIQQQLGQCKVLLAVIGPTWVTVEKNGQRRLEDPADWVRIEIQRALANPAITVIPLLVGGIFMPGEAALPEDLKPLARLNGAQARPDPDFHVDMNRLIRRVEAIVGLGQGREQTTVSWDLTQEQRKQWRAALIHAFPGQPNLELMLGDELGESLNQITQGQPNYQLVVRDVVNWAEAQGKLRPLLEGALNANPNNPKLLELDAIWLKT
jgi:hypothetical protein